jgi:hypothetical protein
MPNRIELPVELWQHIVGFLDVRTAARLLRSSKYHSRAVKRALDNHTDRFWPVKVVNLKKKMATERILDLKTGAVLD